MVRRWRLAIAGAALSGTLADFAWCQAAEPVFSPDDAPQPESDATVEPKLHAAPQPKSDAAVEPKLHAALQLESDAAVEESWLVPSLHAVGLMSVMRVGEAVIWPEPFADLNLRRVGARYEAAFTQPPKWDSSARPFEWDGDPWYVNAVGHSLFGSELYLRPRMCRKSVLEALAFTTLASGVWEYGFEANGVRPSAFDLWYTPAVGLVLGELRLVGYRGARGISDPTWRVVLSTVLDPLGEFERALGTPC